jgi:pSer/pThr/pTyr-binding forkhead associated (FHA) protein
MKREVQIKLKAVSADHCNITYDDQKGWFISESGKDKPSSNGTFVFMKSQKQMHDHEPSSLIPLHDGMVLSFINYEIRVNLEKKEQGDVDRDNQNIRERVEQMRSAQPAMGATMPAQVPAEVVEEPAAAEPEAAIEVKPEQSIHDEEDVKEAE